MKKRILSLFVVLLLAFTLVACSALGDEVVEQPVVATVVVEKRGAYEQDSVYPMEAPEFAPMAVEATPAAMIVEEGAVGLPSLSALPGQMMVKNAEMRLLVEDASIAVDRLTQVVQDLDGYILSSHIWTQEVAGEEVQFASLTLNVPADAFEQALTRLRQLSVRVLDESAAGQDVTSEYVDLEARLKNLEATRDRIRQFLAQAKDVDEAILVNDRLSLVEGEIEQIKGRMNYLSTRAAYSTINVQLEPEATLLIPLPTPAPWDPSHTYAAARNSLTQILHDVVDALIWFSVVLLPLLVVLALLALLLRWLLRREKKKIQA